MKRVTSVAAKTALTYREMLERVRKTLQDAWEDEGSAVIGNQFPAPPIANRQNMLDDLPFKKGAKLC